MQILYCSDIIKQTLYSVNELFIVMSPQPKGRGNILLLVQIPSASALFIVCTLSPERMGGF